MILVDLKEKLKQQISELEDKVKFLDEKNNKSLRIIVQGDKFQNMLNSGKHNGDMTGIGCRTTAPKPNKDPYNGLDPNMLFVK